MSEIVQNSCIFYLVNNNQIHLSRLQSSLKCLNDNFLNKYPYPVVFGYDNLSDDIKYTISTWAPKNHFFRQLVFELPDYSTEIKNNIPEKFKGHWDENAYFSLGYRHMCRYFAGEMFKDSFFEKVNYFLRLDCDSYILEPLTYDPIRYMADNDIKYGTVGEKENELDYVIIGFKDFLLQFFDKEYTLPSVNKTYDTHFELVDYKWFKTSDYMKYYSAIDQTGKIFTNRWGDAPIKYQGVNYFVPKNKIHVFNIPYKHGGNL
jgi:alpha 1,2-mannosyltransferase